MPFESKQSLFIPSIPNYPPPPKKKKIPKVQLLLLTK